MTYMNKCEQKQFINKYWSMKYFYFIYFHSLVFHSFTKKILDFFYSSYIPRKVHEDIAQTEAN